MSADDTYDEQVHQKGRDVSHWPVAGWVSEDGMHEALEGFKSRIKDALRMQLPYANGGQLPPRPIDSDSIPALLSKGKVITDPDEAEALGLRLPRGPGAMWNPSPCSADGFRCGRDAEFGQEFCAEHTSRVPLEMLDAVNDTGTCWTQILCPHDRDMTPIGRSVPLEAYVPCDCYQDPTLNKCHLYDMHDSNRSYNDPEGWAAHEASCPECRGDDGE